MTFTHDDVELFSKASHDRNPLHLSEEYGRRTAFGERVVFGGLAALACLGRLSPRRSASLSRLSCEFASPVMMDVDYQVDITEDDHAASIVLRDGRRVVARMSVTFQDSRHVAFASAGDASYPAQSISRSFAELSAGFSVAGRWAPDMPSFQRLRDRYDLHDRGGDNQQQATLLWASYLVGMEIPGERALFSRFTVTFDSGETRHANAFEYTATVTSANPHFRLVTVSATLRCDTIAFASAEIAAFVREDVPTASREELDDLCPSSAVLHGRVGLVIGASRGLGAAIAQGLALQGCTVVANYARSAREAEALNDVLRDAPGTVVLERGDATDVRWCAGLRDRIMEKYGRLDYLITSASPPLLPLWVEGEAVSRIVDHVRESLKLVLSPLATCLDALAKSGGTHVLVSSSVVTKPVATWPHYVSAKCALEGLVSAASAEYPAVKFVVMRPPRLRTDLTNTPLSRQGALPAAVAANQLIVALVADRHAPKTGITYLDRF